MINHNSTSEVRALLEREGLTLKKRFGQNFLVDERYRRRIAHAVLALPAVREAVTEVEAPVEGVPIGRGAGEVWEIGPGIGSLSVLLAEGGVPLRVFEIDHGLVRVLVSSFGARAVVDDAFAHGAVAPAPRPNGATGGASEGERNEVSFQKPGIRIVRGDFLDVVDGGGAPLAICGNLPYAAAGPMIARIAEAPFATGGMVFMVQTELAERLAAPVGGKDYGALSVLVQSHYTIARLFDVPAGAFFPRPRVGSTVIALTARTDRPSSRRSARIREVARRAFAGRRKTMRNTLKEFVSVMEAVGIDPALRPERLSPRRFAELAAALDGEDPPSR